MRKPPAFVHLLILSSFALTGCAGGGGGSTSGSTSNHSPDAQPSPSLTKAPYEHGEPVLVGVADSGFRLTHESIRSHIVSATNLADPSDADVTSNSRHGTAVASVVTMSSGDADLLLAKVNRGDDSFAYANVMDYSVGFLADEEARVINHSYSGRLEAPSETASYLGERSLDSLHKIVTSNDGLGTVYVVAAANDGEALSASNPIHRYAGIFERMLIVGGAEGDGLHPYSNYPGTDQRWQSRFLTAPWKSEVALDDADDSYGLGHGTSFAAPKVTAYAAAIIEMWPHLSAMEVTQLLLETASKDSPLYQDNTCGTDNQTNCGYYYLGQGDANVAAALAPQGELVLPSGDMVQGSGHRVSKSAAQLSGVYGKTLASSGALDKVAVFDELGRDYKMDLTPNVAQRTAHDVRMRRRMERIAVASSEYRSVSRGELGGFDFMARHTAYGDTTATRVDGHLGRSRWSAYRFSGDEASPASPFAEANVMPMLSLQGGSELTRALEVVSGIAHRFALGDRFALTTEYWTGQTDGVADSMLEDYRANRSNVSLAIDLNDRLTLTAGAGVLQEEQGLLGAQGSAALTLGEDNETTMGRVHLDYRWNDSLSAFAVYEQGRGQASGDGLIQRIDDIRTEEMTMGLQWRSENRQAALILRQPMRIANADATLDVPTGRTLDGRVLREVRSASLAPSGQQRDVEIGYAIMPTERSRLQFNALYSTEPGHDRDANDEVAILFNYSRGF